MNVLITGGYGFIGSHVAEKFFKEGYQVYIIDNLSTGSAKNVTLKHTFFHLDVVDQKCDQVFRSNKFDVVVHLAAQINVVSSIDNPYQDTRSNLLGLTNMLQLSARHDVKKFILASSAAVYGHNQEVPLGEEAELSPQSPYGLSKATGELYCNKWRELYGLDTICFRLSNVYGPRQGAGGEGGVVSIFLRRLLEQRELVVFGDGKQTRDFIYVKDVADAIYESVQIDISGVYNLSTNMQSSVNELIEVLGRLCPVKQVSYSEAREGDIKDSCLDNTRIKGALGWVPQYTLEEGLSKTYAWFRHHLNESRKHQVPGGDSPARAPLGEQLQILARKAGILPYLENFLVFMIVGLLTITSEGAANNYLLDYKLIYIVLIGAVHGMRQAVLASLLSCALYVFLYLGAGRDFIALVQDTNSLLQLSLYILVGVVMGYVTDSKNNELQAKDALLKSAEDKYAFLNAVHNQTLVVKDELCDQIISSRDSYGKVYAILTQLDQRDPGEIYAAGVAVLENIMKSNRVAIYSLTDSKSMAVLAAKSEPKEFIVPDALMVREREDIQKAIETNEIFVNRNLSPHLPVMTAPIVVRGEVIAVASTHSMEFENLTLHRHNLFKVAVNLISHSLSHVPRSPEKVPEAPVHLPNVAELR